MTLPQHSQISTAMISESEPALGSTGRNVVVVTGARVSLVAVWFGATILMARILGQRGFGLYTLYTRTIGLVTGCFGDPLDMAVMREAPLFLKTDRPRAVEIVRSAFWMRVGLGVLSVVLAAVVPWGFVGRGNEHNLLMLTALGILGDLMLRSVLGYFQVGEQFGAFMVIDCIWQLGRATAVVIFVMFHMLRAETALLIYVALPFIGFVVATLILPADVMRVRWVTRRQMAAIFHYSKWMVAALMMAALYERMDVFLLGWFHGAAIVGIYGAAMILAVVPDFIDGGMQTVLGPKVAPAFAAGKFSDLQRTYLMYSVPLGICAALGAVLLGGPVVRHLLSVRFASSVGPFRILVLSTLFNLVFTPLPAALLNFVAPRKVAVLTFLGLVMVSVGGFAVIPRYGMNGAAGVILITRVFIGIAIMVMAGRLGGASADRLRTTSPGLV